MVYGTASKAYTLNQYEAKRKERRIHPEARSRGIHTEWVHAEFNSTDDLLFSWPNEPKSYEHGSRP